MLEEGYVKMFRQLKRWQHYQKPSVVLVWIDILLSANTQDAWWHGRKIRRGELFTSIDTIHQSTGLDPKTIRKALATLEESGEIKIESTNAGTKIAVNHFDKFQSWGIIPQPIPQPVPQPTPQPTPQRVPYKQEYKEVKEGKNVKKEKNNNSAPSVRTRYEKIFEDVFLNRTGLTFSWNKREAIAVNSIIGKIEKITLGQNKVPTPDVKADGFRWFLDKLYDTGDGWITSNFVPHVINDKFNEYYLTIKNGRNGKQNNDNPSNVSEEWLRAILTRNVQS